MADRRFFTVNAPISIRDLAALTGATPALRSGDNPDGAHLFHDVAPLDRAGDKDVSFLDNPKYGEAFANSKAGACFVRPRYVQSAPSHMVLLVTEQPYYAYALAAQYFYPASAHAPGIAASASIAKSASIGKNVRIDSGVVIGERATIGDDCTIGANSVIGDGVEIGAGSRVGALCSISHSIIGKNFVCHRGVHIGQDGFGYAPGGGGITAVPQLGAVIIGDSVEIGSGTCVDRGAGPDTIIGTGSKIDNLVQIGHNVQIGRYVVIVAQCGISGSTKIGDGAQVGGQVGMVGHVSVGAGAKIAAQSGVMADVPPGVSYGGTPAVPIKNWHRQSVLLAHAVSGAKGKLLSDE